MVGSTTKRLKQIPNENRPYIKKIRSEYGTLEDFVHEARKWLSELPRGCFEENKYLQPFLEKIVDWTDPQTLSIIYKIMTSVEHAEWLHSVIDRMKKIEREIENSHLIGMSKVPDPTSQEKLQERFEKERESALVFIRDVRTHIYKELDVTERQLDALNDIYERYKQIDNSYGGPSNPY